MMVAEQEKTGAAMVADLEYFADDNWHLQSWFFMLDMAQYPSIKDNWDYTPRRDGKGWRGTGYLIQEHIWEQGRLIAPLPAGIKDYWRHPTHISVLSAPQIGENWAVRQVRYAKIQEELKRLRAAP